MGMIALTRHRPVDMARPRLGTHGHERYEQHGNQPLQSAVSNDHGAKPSTGRIEPSRHADLYVFAGAAGRGH